MRRRSIKSAYTGDSMRSSRKYTESNINQFTIQNAVGKKLRPGRRSSPPGHNDSVILLRGRHLLVVRHHRRLPITCADRSRISAICLLTAASSRAAPRQHKLCLSDCGSDCHLVDEVRIELTTFAFGKQYSNQLSYPSGLGLLGCAPYILRLSGVSPNPNYEKTSCVHHHDGPRLCL